MSSQFSSGEILSIIVAWVVLSVAITYQKLVGLLTGTGSLDVVIAGFVATATGFILHETGHKFVAIRRGDFAPFPLWFLGAFFTISPLTISRGGGLFGAPGGGFTFPSSAAVSRCNSKR